MRKRLLSLAILAGILATIIVPAHTFAGDGAPRLGDVSVLAGGYESKVTGFTSDGKPIYTADFGAPTYLPDLKTKIDTTWHADGNNYTSGKNLLTASVSGEFVNVADNSTWASAWWLPTATVSNLDTAKDKSGIKQGRVSVKNAKPTVLAVDPTNSNYKNNTLQWDMGNGVYRRLRLTEGVVQEYYEITKPIAGDFKITHGLTVDGTFSGTLGKAVAWDADHKPVDLTADSGSLTLTKDKSLDSKVKYPITIDPDMTFTTSASDGYISYDYLNSGTNLWTTMHDATNGNMHSTANIAVVNTSTTYSYGYNGIISRGLLYFDTSALASYTITSANVSLYTFNHGNHTSWTLQVQSGMATYPHDPMTLVDYNKNNYSGNGGTVASSSFVDGQYLNIPLNGTGLGWINTTGTTKFVLRELQHDINNSDISGGTNSYTFYTYEQGVAYRPKLVVVYMPIAPGITSQPATNVAQTTARLNATVTTDGGEPVEVTWGYGTTSQTAGNFTSYDTQTVWTTANYTTGQQPYLDVDSLAANTPYYYRVQATNSNSTVTSVTEQTFTTVLDVNGVSQFYGTPLATSNSLSWVRGSGDSETLVRWRADDYPADVNDGEFLYKGTASTFDHTLLTSGKTYYYSAWGESGGSYSTAYMTLALTTLPPDLYTGPAGDASSYSFPSQFNQDPQTSQFAGLEPIPTLIKNFASSWQMPENNTWYLGFMALIIMAFLGIYVKSHSFYGATTVALIMMFFGVALKIIPGWQLFVPLSALGAGWALSHMRGQTT